MALTAKILVVDDEESIVKTVTDILVTFGYNVVGYTDSVAGYKYATEENPDLIILDWMMPQMNGVQFIQSLRSNGYTVPVIFLTALGGDSDYQVSALNLGANDFISKPVKPAVLAARVAARLRDYNSSMNKSSENGTVIREGNKHIYCGGELIIDMDANQAFRFEENCNLTTKEFDLLCYLEENAGRVCKRTELMKNVWNFDFTGDARTVDVTVRRTREKIEPNSLKFKYILTRRGVGYIFPKEIKET